jgi:hypothetical protein
MLCSSPRGSGMLAQDLQFFIDAIRQGSVEVYNEFSLQHELGVFLRQRRTDCLVQFERNVSHFGLKKAAFEKKEIDIAVTDRATGRRLCAVELKYPRNGQVPETMFSFCKDIAFLEQLVESGFECGLFLAVADDPLFYSGREDGIYGLFRSGRAISGVITKPTGKKDHEVSIRGAYRAAWADVAGPTKFCIVQIGAAPAPS